MARPCEERSSCESVTAASCPLRAKGARTSGGCFTWNPRPRIARLPRPGGHGGSTAPIRHRGNGGRPVLPACRCSTWNSRASEQRSVRRYPVPAGVGDRAQRPLLEHLHSGSRLRPARPAPAPGGPSPPRASGRRSAGGGGSLTTSRPPTRSKRARALCGGRRHAEGPGDHRIGGPSPGGAADASARPSTTSAVDAQRLDGLLEEPAALGPGVEEDQVEIRAGPARARGPGRRPPLPRSTTVPDGPARAVTIRLGVGDVAARPGPVRRTPAPGCARAAPPARQGLTARSSGPATGGGPAGAAPRAPPARRTLSRG